jgi:hypothetical protein
MGQCRANTEVSPLRRACTSCSHRHQRSSYRPPAAYKWSLRRPVSGLIVASYIFLTAPRTTCSQVIWLFFIDICTTETTIKRQIIASQPRQGHRHPFVQCASRRRGVSMVSPCHRGFSKFPDAGSHACHLVLGSTRDGESYLAHAPHIHPILEGNLELTIWLAGTAWNDSIIPCSQYCTLNGRCLCSIPKPVPGLSSYSACCA